MIKKTKNWKKSFFSKRKKIFIASCFGVVATVPLISCVAAYQINKSPTTYSGSYGLNDKTFNSYNSLMEYVDSSSEYVQLESNNSNWTATINGVTKTYSDPNELRQMLFDEYVTVKQVKTDINLKDYANSDGVIQMNNQDVLKHISENTSNTSVVYQGNNDVAYLNEEDAYKSYFQVQQGYYYNGIYFADLAKLRTYLQNEYFPNLNNNNTIVLSAPNGKSVTINLSQTNAYEKLVNFVNENAEINLNYQNSSNEIVSINKNNINEEINNINLKDLDYYHVQSNQGQTRYIIDNKDSADLIGPYFYDGVLDVASFTNKKMWKKVGNVSQTVFTESKIDSMIGSFFTSIINDDNNLNLIQSENNENNTLLFRTLLTTSDGKSYDKWFLDELKRLNSNLANEVIKANNNMMSGKKYNSFFKIPVLYSFLIQRIVSYGLSQEVMNLVIDYFTNVCNFIQDALELVCLNSDNLLLDKNKQKKFNMVDFFNIGNPEYDINTSTQYFLNQIKEQYPNLIATMLVYTQAENNISLAGGLIPFKSIDFDYLWENNIISINDLYSIKYELENIYNTFSTLDSFKMVKSFILYNQDYAIRNIASTVDESEWEEKLNSFFTKNCKQSVGDLLTSIGSKNNQYYTLSESILNTEIKMFLETGMIVKNGYLNLLQDKNSSKDKLSTFINYVKTNEQNINTYRIYLAFVLDKKMNTNFLNEETISSSELFGFRLVSLIETVFGSFALVGSTISQMYAIKSSVPSAANSEILNLMNDDDYVYEIVDLSDKKWNKALDIQKMENDGKMFFENDIFKINNDFVNPEIVKNSGLPSNYKIVLSDLDEVIRNSSTDYDDNLLQLIKESNELKAVDRIKNYNSNYSVIMNPTDNASLQSSKAFNYSDETLSMVTNSIYSGDWGYEQIPGFDDDLIGSKPNISGTYDDVDFSKQKKSWWSGDTSTFNKIKEMGLKGLSYALVVFEPIFTLTEIFLFVYDLLQETYTQNFYEYTTIDGTSFYWNGGLSVSKYFGFYNKELHNIDEMELLDPIAVTLPQIEEFYFYNGIKYYDVTELKRRILMNYLNNNVSVNNSKFKKYYSLNKNGTMGSFSINELINNIISDLNITKNENGSFNFQNLNKNSSYIKSLSASYDYGYVVPDGDYVTLANNIIENIRPTNFVVLPDVNNGVSSGKISSTISFPGKYYDGKNIIENDNVTNVLIDNSANDLKQNFDSFQMLNKNSFVTSDSKIANEKSIENLYSTFINSFKIANKEILNLSFSTNKYSELPNQTITQNIYEVKNFKSNKTLTFYDLNDVSNYLMKNIDFVKNTDYLPTKIYFESMWFDNKNQLVEWVHNNMYKVS